VPLFTSDGLGLVILVLVLRTWSCYITVSVLICGKNMANWDTAWRRRRSPPISGQFFWIAFYHIISWMYIWLSTMEVEYRISNLLVRTAPCKNASRYTYLTVAYSHLNRSSVDGIAERQRIDILLRLAHPQSIRRRTDPYNLSTCVLRPLPSALGPWFGLHALYRVARNKVSLAAI